MLKCHQKIAERKAIVFFPHLMHWLFILTLVSFGCSSMALAESRVVKIGVYENSPKVFTDESGRPSGIFVDIIKYIASKEDWKLQYVAGTWAEGLDRLERGQIDLMPDVALTAEREKLFSFHKIQVLSSWFQAYARKDSGLQSILDLNGKRVAILDKSVQQEAFTRFSRGFGLDTKLVAVADYKTMFEMVANGDVDAAVTNQFYGSMHARKYDLVDTAIVFEPSALFFAAPKNQSQELLDAIDQHLDLLKKDTKSEYYRILRKWTSEEVRFKIPLWIKILALVIGIVLFMSLWGSIILKRQVNARTEELSKSEKKYRDIFENAVIGVYQSTPAGRFQSVNPAFAKLFGYETPEELIKNIKDIQSDVYVNPEERLRFKKLFTEQGEVKDFQAEFKRRDGSHFWISISGKAIRNDQGRITHYEGTIEDINARKNAENELAIYRDHLEELVKERTSQLAEAMEKAQSADRLKSAFLATMSHELRTPLNSIIGFTGILLQRLGGPLNEEQEKQLKMVYNSAKHLLSLINDVLDISKIEAEQLNVVSETFNLRETVEKVIKASQPLAENKNLNLTAEIAPEIGLMKSDRRRVEQILLNLLSNAIKFTEQGFVRMKCEIRNGKMVIAVSDSGIGIKPEDIGILFNPFRQIESGTTRKYDGTGLGLSICKKLAHLLGGEVRVESIWGHGSTFSLMLPQEGEMGKEQHLPKQKREK